MNDNKKLNIIYSDNNGNKAFILSENGNGLFLDKKLYDSILDGTLSEELKYKLYLNSFYKKDRFDPRTERPKISFFMIDFSTCCNLSCYYCLRDFVSKGTIIKMDELNPILEYIKDYVIKNSVKKISIQPWGGEPLLAYKEILAMDDFFKENNINASIIIQTNGTLLNEKMIVELFKRNIYVSVSLDGNKAIHNIHRKYNNGVGTYDDVVNGIRLLQKYTKNPISTISVISKMSLDYLEDSVIDMVKNLKLKKLKFNFVHPNSDAFPLDSVVKEEDIPIFYERLFSILLKLIDEGYPVTEVNIYDRIINLFKGWNVELCHSNGCLGGYKFVTFGRDGNVYPCELVGNEKVKIGNIKESELTDLLDKSIKTNPYFKPKHNDKCNICPWYNYCRGGCTASIISYKKDFTDIDIIQCKINEYLYPKLIEYAINDKEIIRKLSLNEIIIGE